MVRVIVAETKINCDHLIGQFLDERHYDIIINEDCDAYAPPSIDMSASIDCDDSRSKFDVGSDEKRIVFKFRKNFFTKQQQDDAYIGLREAAKESQNRGLAAGPRGEKLDNREWVSDEQLEILEWMLNPQDSLFDQDPVEEIRNKYKNIDVGASRGFVWLANKVAQKNLPLSKSTNGFIFDQWVDSARIIPRENMMEQAAYVFKNLISQTTYANGVLSGIAGWFDRYPRIPYGRATSYTRDNWDKFQQSFTFLQRLNDGFKELLPWRWNNQRKTADKIDQCFLIPGTVFTTVTVNKNFRTAAHLDAGDYADGLSNLLVVSNGGEYEGCYLIAPEYRIAVNVRPGDLLLINNHEVIHANSPIKLNNPDAERISLVCYFREKMLELGSKEYEDCRFNFVESRRLNSEHPLWKPLWNGVSSGMWEDKEWYLYLESNLGKDAVDKYHPQANKVNSTLEDLF